MTDLSRPPLNLLPTDGDASRATSSGGAAWPAPPLPGYPAALAIAFPAACEIVGTNGRTMKGQLNAFDPAAGMTQVIVPPAKAAMPLRFAQFQRITLSVEVPLNAIAASEQGVVTPYRLLKQGVMLTSGMAAAQVERPEGLYLFEPSEAGAALRRVFVPRAAFDQAVFGDTASNANAREPAPPAADNLLLGQITTPEQLMEAIAQQSRMPMVRIGEALIALGFISEDQLKSALKQQRADRSLPLGEVLVTMGMVSRPDLQTALARKMGYPLVDVTQFEAETDALTRLPFSVASRLQALPLLLRGGRLIVAMDDPSRPDRIDEIEFAIEGKVIPVLAFSNALPVAIDKAYERMGADVRAARQAEADASGNPDFDLTNTGDLLASLEQAPSENGEPEGNQIEQSDNSLVRLINSMIVEAQSQGVSDIHVECQPGKQKVRIRFRKDGALKPYLELPPSYRSALIARIKIMCDLDISEKRKPQDGKINFSRFVPGARLELRVATIPTNNGLEDAVLRLLASAKPLPLDNLGLSPDNLRKLKYASERPYGMILCVGPTGSGKTTTLHSVLGFINTPERKLWTAEDPVEITQAGIRQVQVNPKIDFTFAKALKAFLRADPDVIMVGEIRDSETAGMAVEASLTGHLVMSTLHTNSAPETVTRLLDMGMDPFNFADALLAVLAQRLVRRICSKCIESRPATEEEIDELLRDYMAAFLECDNKPAAEDIRAQWVERFGKEGGLQHYRGKGCPACDKTGMRGRAGIHELLTGSRDMRHLIQTGARPNELAAKAMGEGMRTLRQDGIEKVLAGVTTIEEVRATSN
jgi:type II secretory ATPase GspE/PulE/Tfp pilus assembly ATPase PilB-like protein